jgi:hypothetical protein
MDKPQSFRVVGVPDAKHLARPGFLSDKLDPLGISIAKHELERIDVPLEQPPEWQAARANRTQDFAQGQAR